MVKTLMVFECFGALLFLFCVMCCLSLFFMSAYLVGLLLVIIVIAYY